jgi:Flp pilus assembly protein TadG
MARNALFDLLYRRLHELRTANGANVTVIFALATVPMIGFVGAAVDYSHANAVKTAMQAAADTTALMLSKNAAGLTSAQLTTKANEYFKALFTRTDATGLTIGATYTSGTGSQVVVTASASVKADFMKLMGMPQMNVGVDSQVKWGTTRLRVALALDTTGSMNDDGKIGALKTATKNLLNTLKAAATKDGDVYVSIIPFSKDVNVGKSNYTKSWVRWDIWEEYNGECRYYEGWTKPNSKAKCKYNSGYWDADDRSTWNGCITDRDKDYDIKNTAPSTTTTGTLFPADQYSDCPAQMMGLSYDWTALTSKVDSLYPAGNTNQGIGIAWAFQSLTAAPFTVPAKDSNYTYQEVIILLTDGLNTENRYSNDQADIDARELLTCANAKTAKITIYTIQVNTTGDPIQNVLKSCASSPEKFYALSTASALNSVFNTIGNQLTQLRISQ